MQERWLGSLNPAVRLDRFRLVSSIVALVFFSLGLILSGSTHLYGVFYALSFLAGAPLLRSIDWPRMEGSRLLWCFLAAATALNVLFLLHLVIASAPAREVENPVRLLLGIVNGAYLFALFSYRRATLFWFLTALAFAHGVVAAAVAFYQRVDLSTLTLLAGRAHGITSAISFAEILMCSAGLAAIAIVGSLSSGRPLLKTVLLILFLALTFQGTMLTETRGVIIAVPLLLLLMAANLRRRPRIGQVALAFCLLLAAVVPFWPILERAFGPVLADAIQLANGGSIDVISASVGIRLQMWSEAIQLVSSRPLFGYGLGSFPDVLRDPSLGLPPDSVLFGFDHVHNQFLDLLLETGLVGLALFSALVVLPIVAGVRLFRAPATRSRGLALIWVAGSYIIFGLTQVFMAHSASSLQFAVYLGILMWTIPARDRETAPAERPSEAEGQNALT